MMENSVVGAVDPPQQVLFTFLFYTMEFPLVTYRPIVPKIVSKTATLKYILSRRPISAPCLEPISCDISRFQGENVNLALFSRKWL